MTSNRIEQCLEGPARAFIVDDERLGRELVRNLAESTPEIEIIEEFSSGRAAAAAIGARPPDVVFLDIKMPDVDGMSVAREILASDCLVIFVTAFEAHALEAFEVQAFDYLLKPVELEKFKVVVKRICQMVRRFRLERFIASEPAKSLLTDRFGTPDSKAYDKIRVPQAGSIRYIDPRKVIWFEAANQYVNIHACSGNYMISTESLNSLQKRVDARKFVRVHRSALVNVDYARRIVVGKRSSYFIEMENGDRVPVSRGNRSTLVQMDIE